MSTPTVTTGLLEYYGERYVAEATNEFCRRHRANDPQVRYHRVNIDRGASWNSNRVVELAQDRYFRHAAHDDVLALKGARGMFRGDAALRFDNARSSDRFAVLLSDHRCFEVFGLIRTYVDRISLSDRSRRFGPVASWTRHKRHCPWDNLKIAAMHIRSTGSR